MIAVLQFTAIWRHTACDLWRPIRLNQTLKFPTSISVLEVKVRVSPGRIRWALFDQDKLYILNLLHISVKSQKVRKHTYTHTHTHTHKRSNTHACTHTLTHTCACSNTPTHTDKQIHKHTIIVLHLYKRTTFCFGELYMSYWTWNWKHSAVVICIWHSCAFIVKHTGSVALCGLGFEIENHGQK